MLLNQRNYDKIMCGDHHHGVFSLLVMLTISKDFRELELRDFRIGSTHSKALSIHGGNDDTAYRFQCDNRVSALISWMIYLFCFDRVWWWWCCSFTVALLFHALLLWMLKFFCIRLNFSCARRGWTAQIAYLISESDGYSHIRNVLEFEPTE